MHVAASPSERRAQKTAGFVSVFRRIKKTNKKAPIDKPIAQRFAAISDFDLEPELVSRIAWIFALNPRCGRFDTRTRMRFVSTRVPSVT